MDFQKDEYEIQYYDFCLSDFEDQTKLMSGAVVKNIVNAVTKKINDKEGAFNASEAELKKAVDKTVNTIALKIAGNMKPYEDLLEKYLAIPDYVILPEDKKHDVNKTKEVSEADILNIKIQTQMMESEVTEMAKIMRTLEEELQQYETMKHSFGEIEEMLELVENRLAVNVQQKDLKKSLKYIEGLIKEKNNN